MEKRRDFKKGRDTPCEKPGQTLERGGIDKSWREKEGNSLIKVWRGGEGREGQSKSKNYHPILGREIGE